MKQISLILLEPLDETMSESLSLWIPRLCDPINSLLLGTVMVEFLSFAI